MRELLAGQRGRSLLIGDGNSDLLASTAVDLFVGYGGIIKRQRVLTQSPVYLHTTSLAPLTAVAAGPAAISQLQSTPHFSVFQKGLDLIQTGALTFNDERLKSKFTEAVNAAYQTFYPRPD